MKTTGLIVGNGFTLDSVKRLPAIKGPWNPSLPLSWQFEPISGVEWRTAFPNLSAAVSRVREKKPGLDDFGVLGALAEDEDSMISCEVRHFLATGYSRFQEQLDLYPVRTHPWPSFLGRLGTSLSWVASFNYDLLLERAIQGTGRSVRRLGVRGESVGVPVLKPHGSCDFDVGNTAAINLGPPVYPLRIFRQLNSTNEILSLKPSELRKPRIEPVAIAPNEIGKYRKFFWVRGGVDSLAPLLAATSECIIVGHSYGVHDRIEVDELLGLLPSRCKIVIGNPSPPLELKAKVASLGFASEDWVEPPQ